MIWGHDYSMQLLVKIRQENKNGMVLFINYIFANF